MRTPPPSILQDPLLSQGPLLWASTRHTISSCLSLAWMCKFRWILQKSIDCSIRWEVSEALRSVPTLLEMHPLLPSTWRNESPSFRFLQNFWTLLKIELSCPYHCRTRQFKQRNNAQGGSLNSPCGLLGSFIAHTSSLGQEWAVRAMFRAMFRN